MRLTKEEAAVIFADVRANRGRLDDCPGHRFNPAKEYVFGGKMTCTVCGGQMTNTDILVYAKGYRAAGGDPELVWPGLFDKKPQAN